MKSNVIAAYAASLLSNAAAQQFVMYTPGGDDTSVQRADPILSPGKISQHVHQIFGSNAFAPEVSYESLQKADCTTVADASNNGNADDNSIYWHPALYMEASNGTGYIKVPTNGHKLYYKNAGTGTPRSPFEFPHGFRMLAGNPFMRAAATDLQQQNITQWICHDSTGTNQGTSGGFPTGVENCDAVDGFNGALHFPHCWNGDDFDPANPTAHIVYPTGDIENGECPSSHPTRLPHIFMENTFNLDAVYGQVKPDSFVLAMGDNTGYGWHADFFSGWVDGAIPALLAQCPQGEYGNEDVGDCPNFKKRSTPASDCKLKVSYVEKVEDPGKNLPGCNPVRDTNPAPFYETAPLGTYSTNCKLVSGGGPPASGGSSSAAVEPAGSGTSSASTQASTSTNIKLPHTHTKSTLTTIPSSQPTGGNGGSSKISCPASDKQIYTVGGKKFKVQCGIDHSGGDLKHVQASSLSECISECAKTDGCVDVSLSGVACYLKSERGPRVTNSAIVGAKLIHASKQEARFAEPTPSPLRVRHITGHGAHMRRHAVHDF